MEGGGLFSMERAQPAKSLARLLECHELPHDLDNVRGGPDLFSDGFARPQNNRASSHKFRQDNYSISAELIDSKRLTADGPHSSRSAWALKALHSLVQEIYLTKRGRSNYGSFLIFFSMGFYVRQRVSPAHARVVIPAARPRSRPFRCRSLGIPGPGKLQ